MPTIFNPSVEAGTAIPQQDLGRGVWLGITWKVGAIRAVLAVYTVVPVADVC